MSEFLVFRDGKKLPPSNSEHLYLIGPEEVPVPGRINIDRESIKVSPSMEDAVGLALPWEISGVGNFLLQTTRLPDRSRPYIINLELLRWRLMRIFQRMEDWGLLTYSNISQITSITDNARKLFIQALQNYDTPSLASQFADNGLAYAIEAGEKLAQFHAKIMLETRLQMGGIGRKLFGVSINVNVPPAKIPLELFKYASFVELQANWKTNQPEENRFDFSKLDKWIEFLVKNKVAIKFGTLVSFDESALPSWIEGINFEDLREQIHQYLTAIAKRYSKVIRSWVILDGIHAENPFNLNFEQILDLTRISTLRAKQILPKAHAIIGILYPWGEYCARNPRTIQPYLYAEMVAQSGISCDAFKIHLPIASKALGGYTRDFLQISSLIDRFSILGLPIHLATSAPSRMEDKEISSGYWSAPWSETTQADWFSNFTEVAFSKFSVESIIWTHPMDEIDKSAPFSGLIDSAGNAKPILARFQKFQNKIVSQKSR